MRGRPRLRPTTTDAEQMTNDVLSLTHRKYKSPFLFSKNASMIIPSMRYSFPLLNTSKKDKRRRFLLIQTIGLNSTMHTEQILETKATMKFNHVGLELRTTIEISASFEKTSFPFQPTMKKSLINSRNFVWWLSSSARQE